MLIKQFSITLMVTSLSIHALYSSMNTIDLQDLNKDSREIVQRHIETDKRIQCQTFFAPFQSLLGRSCYDTPTESCFNALAICKSSYQNREQILDILANNIASEMSQASQQDKSLFISECLHNK